MEEFLEFLEKELEERGKNKRVRDAISSYFRSIKILFLFLKEEKGLRRFREEFFSGEECTQHFREFLDQFSKSKLLPGTKMKYNFNLKKFFDFCVKHEPIRKNPQWKERASEISKMASEEISKCKDVKDSSNEDNGEDNSFFVFFPKILF